jgi:capsular exopolysaccharide synthesis family protein
MDLRTYLAALRKSWWIILATALLGVAAGAALFVSTPPTYASTVDFYVSTPSTAGVSAQSGSQFAQGRVNSYIVLLSSEELGERVVDSTGVQLKPLEVANKVTATTELNTVTVTATVTDGSAQRSLQIAQGVADEFPKLVDQLDNQGRSNPTVVINVVSGPTLISTPVAPDWRRYLAVGLGAGLVLGLVIAILRELLDTSIRTPEMAQRIVGAPVIGTITYDSDTKKSPLIVGANSSSLRAESYRQLRTNLQFISAARAADVILVTSTLPLEGKTTTSVNLALSFVEFGERVLLIDADLRRPKVAEYLDLEGGVGLTNVLAGQVRLDEAIQPWGTDGLSLLASGTTPPNPSELLGSPRMAEIVDVLRSQYDKIIIDSPPVLPVTDAVVASALAEAVVFVVRSGRTSRVQVANAARALQGVNAEVVGTVLNMKKQTRSERRSYGGNGYYRAQATAVDAHTSARTAPAAAHQLSHAEDDKQPSSY